MPLLVDYTVTERQSEGQPAQRQGQHPGSQVEMKPKPDCGEESYRGSGRLEGKAALITGGDSGIGRACAIAFAKEGADVAIVYLADQEDEDAEDTKRHVEKAGRKCLVLKGDLKSQRFCHECVERTVREFGKLDCLISNAAKQYARKDLDEITPESIRDVFESNVYPAFYLIQAAEKVMRAGATINITTSITSYRGQGSLVDYAATKGALTATIRSFAQRFAEKRIRVNGVAPGPIWTPLIPATDMDIEAFGKKQPLGRVGQPIECATCFVFLASSESSYITGQVLHPNGGEVIGG